MKYWNELLNKLFGWHQYRVRFDYMVGGVVVFSVTSTIGVKDQKLINDHRAVKRARGPITRVPGVPLHQLNNGRIRMEPTCYLGRWKDA